MSDLYSLYLGPSYNILKNVKKIPVAHETYMKKTKVRSPFVYIHSNHHTCTTYYYNKRYKCSDPTVLPHTKKLIVVCLTI